MKRILLFLLCGVLLSAGSAAAQRPLTLDDCVELARRHDRSLAAADREAEAARCEASAARTLALPSLSASGTALATTAAARLPIEGGLLPVLGADGLPTGASAYFPGLDLEAEGRTLCGGGVRVEQPLYAGGRIRLAARMARDGLSLAAEARRRTEAEVVVRTSRAYADAVRAAELRRVAEACRTLLVELERSIARTCREGMKPRNELLRVRVKLNESELNLLRAVHAQRLAAMFLCHCIGRPLTDSLVLEGTIPAAETTALPTGIDDRPEWRIVERQTDLSRRRVELARSERRPQLAAVGYYGYLGGGAVNGRMPLHGWNFTAGLRLSVPLFHFGERTNKVRVAEARYERMAAEREETRRLLQLEATRAADALAEAALEVRMAEASVAAADESLRMSRRCYEAGTESLAELLETQFLWQQARQTAVEARIGRYLRLLEWRQATGRIE